MKTRDITTQDSTLEEEEQNKKTQQPQSSPQPRTRAPRAPKNSAKNKSEEKTLSTPAAEQQVDDFELQERKDIIHHQQRDDYNRPTQSADASLRQAQGERVEDRREDYNRPQQYQPQHNQYSQNNNAPYE